jgi:L-fuconolactonase
MRIDAHQHFWHYNPKQHEWIDDKMSVIRNDFMPVDLLPILQKNNFDGCIAVQADQTEMETKFLIDLAIKNNVIQGVVGWVDLKAENIYEQLAYYKQYDVVRGFRHVLQNEEPDFMLESNFLNGIQCLQDFNYTYDLLIFPQHLPAAIKLVKQNPHQLFVIDHIAKPYIKFGLISRWKKNIELISKYENVFCKISGMVTEVDYKNWNESDFIPYLDIVVKSFGTKRIMYGSDWPVCLVAASYREMLNVVENYFNGFSETEQQDFFGKNAQLFYQLNKIT